MKTPHPSIIFPTPAQILAAREKAGLTQQQAAEVVYTDGRTWRRWEAPEGLVSSRGMSVGVWELFLLKTGQHPVDVLTVRK